MLTAKRYIRINKNLLEVGFSKEKIIGKVVRNRFCSPCLLNYTSRLIWDELKRPCAIERLAEKLKRRFLISRKTAIDDTKRTINILEKRGFVRECNRK